MQDPIPPQVTFRTGIDLIQVDVSVLDKDRHPVRGLTAADFILLEDGKPRPIVSFAEIHVPAPIVPPTGWMADVAPDVVTNTHPTGRLVVIAHDPVSLSGIIVSATPSARRAPPDAYSDLLPAAPTARRDFATSDRVTTFVRLYQGGSHAVVPVTTITRVVNSRDEQVTQSTRPLNADLFGKTRSFDLSFDLPVRNLAPGEYLMTVTAAAGDKSTQRSLRFGVH